MMPTTPDAEIGRLFVTSLGRPSEDRADTCPAKDACEGGRHRAMTESTDPEADLRRLADAYDGVLDVDTETRTIRVTNLDAHVTSVCDRVAVAATRLAEGAHRTFAERMRDDAASRPRPITRDVAALRMHIDAVNAAYASENGLWLRDGAEARDLPVNEWLMWGAFPDETLHVDTVLVYKPQDASR